MGTRRAEMTLSKWQEWFNKSDVSCPFEVVSISADEFWNEARRTATPEADVASKLGSKEQVQALTGNESACSDVAVAEAKRLIWSEKRKKGLRMVPAKLQSFMKGFADFLEAYSGLVEIAKQADSQYGGLAYSTVSLLLLIAVNKSIMEEKLESAMGNLRRKLPRLGKLQELIPGVENANLISNVYSNVITFARKCILYYSGNSLRRLWKSLRNPAKLYIDKEIGVIDQGIQDIEEEVAICTFQRVQKIEAYNESAGEQQIKHALSEIRNQLTIQPMTFEDLAKYATTLRDPSLNSKKYENFDFNTLQEQKSFKDWLENERSSLLLLYGLTLNARSGLSWLSPAVPDCTFHVRGKGPTKDGLIILFSLGHSLPWMEHGNTSASGIVHQLIVQLLEQCPNYLKHGSDLASLQACMRQQDYRVKNPRLPFKLLSDILACCREYEVFIAIDRVDTCDCGAETFVEHLLELISHSDTKIRVLIVAGSLGNFDVKDIVTSSGDPFYSLRMDQAVTKKGSLKR